jgi:putative ABC transport system substrate-binding protein
MRRREFITLLGGALADQAIPANAQEPVRVRTVAVLMGFADDAEARGRITAFERGLEAEGWSVGKNLWIEYRFTGGDSNTMRERAKELAELEPDCILGHSTPVVTALMQATRTIAIVFVSVSDPIGSGFVASMARPGGNMTGFTIFPSARPRSHPLQCGLRELILFVSTRWCRQGIQGPADHSSSAQPRRD